MALESFNAYHSYLNAIDPLTDAERGRLFTACLIYSKTGEVPDLRGNERFIFPQIKWQIDRDKENYANFCKKQSQNGSKGGRPKNPTEPNQTQKTQRFFEKPKKAYDKDKDKDKDKENTPHTPKGVAFDEFWKAYPKKVGKEAARKAFGKVKVPIESLLTAIERQKCSDQWTKDNGQYIPNPATWLNQGRWEDELPLSGRMGSSEPPRKPRRYREEMIDGHLVAVEVEEA